MLKRIVILTVILCLLFASNVGAVGIDAYDFNMDIGENFSLLTEDTLSKNPEYVESLGHTAESVKKYFADNNLILFAASEDNRMQIQVKCTETEFSKQLYELSLLSSDDAADIAKRLLPKGSEQNYNLLLLDDMLFFEVLGTEKDSGGDFCSLQYITIRGGKLYSIGFFENGKTFSSDFKNVINTSLDSLSIKRKTQLTADKAENTAEVIIVWVLIIAAAALCVGLVVSVMYELTGSKTENGKRTVIIRRRYKK